MHFQDSTSLGFHERYFFCSFLKALPHSTAVPHSTVISSSHGVTATVCELYFKISKTSNPIARHWKLFCQFFYIFD